MSERKENIIVANVELIIDEGAAHSVTLNSTGETPDREALFEEVYNEGINPSDLEKRKIIKLGQSFTTIQEKSKESP